MKFKKLHDIGLRMQRELIVWLRLQQVMFIRLFNVKFEKSIETQHQSALKFGNRKSITISVMDVRTWARMDVHKSVMKEMKITIFNENTRMSLRIAATQIANLTAPCDDMEISETRIENFPYKLQLHQEINGLDKQDKKSDCKMLSK